MKKPAIFKSILSAQTPLLLFLIILITSSALTQEIPNGDGDLLWERSIYPRFVNDAKFHPINGNIIAAVNHEIWEIDPKDGHTIRVFEGGTGTSEFNEINITSDGNTIITDAGSGIDSVLVWNYNTGKIKQILPFNAWYINIFPDNERILIYLTKGQKNTTELGIYNILTGLFEKKINVYPVQQMVLSKDGKYIAFGNIKEIGVNEYSKTMELWDAETLTKIRDYGEDNTIGEFKDIQISSDNKYVAFQGGGHLNLYYLNGEKIGLFLKDDFTTFCFSYNGNYTIIGGLKQNYYQVYVMRNPFEKELYSYSKMLNNFRVNSNNEIFCGSEKIKFYNNNWFTVGVNEPKESQVTISPNPAEDYIEVNVGAIHELPLQEYGVSDAIRIYDIFGKQVLSVETIHELSLQNIDVSALPVGVYFVRIGEKVEKFVKI